MQGYGQAVECIPSLLIFWPIPHILQSHDFGLIIASVYIQSLLFKDDTDGLGRTG